MGFGVPVIATSICSGRHVVYAIARMSSLRTSRRSFASALIDLYQSEDLWAASFWQQPQEKQRVCIRAGRCKPEKLSRLVQREAHIAESTPLSIVNREKDVSKLDKPVAWN